MATKQICLAINMYSGSLDFDSRNSWQCNHFAHKNLQVRTLGLRLQANYEPCIWELFFTRIFHWICRLIKSVIVYYCLLPSAYISIILTLIMDTHASTSGHEYSPLCENKQKQQVRVFFGIILFLISLWSAELNRTYSFTYSCLYSQLIKTMNEQ